VSKVMVNLQDGIDMQTVSISSITYRIFANRIFTSIWAYTRELCGKALWQKITDVNARAVHNFCTSQKAVSSSSHGVIGGAHRGGKFKLTPKTAPSNNISTPPWGRSLPKPHYLSYHISKSSRYSVEDSHGRSFVEFLHPRVGPIHYRRKVH
jgi:hypothetical protein